jgi:hypothetical protein
MRDLLVTKGPKRYCFIVNKYFRCFIANYYTIVLSNEEVVKEIVLFIKLFYIS